MSAFMLFPIEYPKSWFERFKSKPPVQLKATSTSLNELRGTIKSGIKNKNLDNDAAKFYLYLVLKEVKETLDRDWTSYGVSIGSANAEICPWDLLKWEIEEGLTTATDERTEEATSCDDQWMVIYILSIYRFTNTNINIHQRRSMIPEIVNQMKMVDKSFIFSVMDMEPGQNPWRWDSSYHKMIAAVDMFFTRFPLNSWACVKIGTIGSRFQSCGALNALHHLRTVLGISHESLKDWIFTQAIANEMKRMFRDDEEVFEEFSYFPYQVDLGLVDASRSAYSVRVNLQSFSFAHATCALLGSERSINAKYPNSCEGKVNFILTKLNVLIVAYAFSKKLGNPYNSKNNQSGEEGTSSGIPQNTDATAWFNYMKNKNLSNLPQEMLDFLSEAKNKLVRVVRPKTIGQCVLERFK